MSDIVVTNWFGDIVSHPRVVVDAHSVDDIVAVMRDKSKYPSPVRAVGSNHSTAACGVAEGGTLIRMKMDRILAIGTDTVTVEAGALYIDIATALQRQNLQMYINTEIGNLSAGSAACAGTKDASMPGEFGQVGSYVTAVKMVLPSGELLQVAEEKPELMQKVRSSYGTFGVVYEATFRVRKLLPLSVHHKTFQVEEFIEKLPELKALNYSMMFYLFPFDNLMTVEFRKYNPDASGTPERHQWQLRNYLWSVTGPKFAHDAEQNIHDPDVRYKMVDAFGAIWRFKLENLITGQNTIPTDQIIRYPAVSDDSRYTFSLFAFPENVYGDALPGYCKFCQDYYRDKGYRSNMLSVGYRIAQDRNALLSYSYDSDVLTVDPVSTANPGWFDFLVAYNQFCIERGGIPLPNQSDRVTPAQFRKALGARLDAIAAARTQFDPDDRLLNDYFRNLFGPAETSATV